MNDQSLVLGIQTYPGGNAALERHWPFVLRSGASKYVVVTTEGGNCWVPDEVDSIPIGQNRYIDGLHLPMRWLRTLEYLISLEYPWIGIIEYDCLIVRPFPEFEKGFTSNITGGKPLGCECNFFTHCPWICDRDTAIRSWSTAWSMMRSGVKIDPSPDCALGQFLEQSKVKHNDLFIYTQNTITTDQQISEARAAIAAGCAAVHGIKTQEVLEAIFAK